MYHPSSPFIDNLYYSCNQMHVLRTNPTLSPFTHDTFLDHTKLKSFADDKLNVSKMIIFVFDRVENILGKGEIACTSNFSFSHIVFIFDRVENILGKGEIACTSSFSFSHNVFTRFLFQTHQKVSLRGNGLNIDRAIQFSP